eukprot:CAMPEP_0119535574 /NCGR_PEP_ID=MMETSP1344-20130328/48591_1 /TAXON_ID=236787 /ORGANISM="Florenciella parvula, Strain CCMP2471" /LENGTH=31 /DNA_ID= /DNA_START= /DNA_END= /DNA_ORIENTATION=
MRFDCDCDSGCTFDEAKLAVEAFVDTVAQAG